MDDSSTIGVLEGQATGAADVTLRGDHIPGTEYTSPEFMHLEMERVWGKVWNIGGWAAEIPQPGDFITHQLGRESILMARQGDGSVKAFHNVCQHRGNRLVYSESGWAEAFTCIYHGWKYAMDGALVDVQDRDDFAQGDPCGKLRLIEIPSAVWAGFVWYNLDENCRPLEEFLGQFKHELEPYRVEQMTRVLNRVSEVPCNYKCIHDNFCESYHLPTAHPQLAGFFDDDYKNTDFLLYDEGHSLMKMKGALPSVRDADHVSEVLAAEMQEWDLDPAEFSGRAREVRAAMQQQKRKLGPQRGFHHFPGLRDNQLTDRYHFNLFPGLSVTMSPISLVFQRAEPHPTDPNKCIYEQWCLAHGPNKDGLVMTPAGPRPFENADKQTVIYGEESLGFVPDQDLQVCTGQQLGFQSSGFKGMYLAGQEDRVQQFHECLHDYMDGTRPGDVA
ncbi:MAG: aromatic ring-hydroxylating dioxygenase subunit alpha [Sphingomonadales bacterium]